MMIIRAQTSASGRLTVKLRCKRLSATGYERFESVVGRYVRRTIERSPISFILRAT